MRNEETSENIPEIKIIEHSEENETLMSYNRDMSLPELVKTSVEFIVTRQVGRYISSQYLVIHI